MTTIDHSVAELESPRLTMVRRLYFYLVILASLIAGLISFDQLLDVLSEVWLSGGVAVNSDMWVRNAIALNAGILVVATPIFLLHWGYVQRRLNSPMEKQAGLRKFALYLASAVCAGYALYSLDWLLRDVSFVAFGGALSEVRVWPSDWLHLVLMAVAAGALQIYLHSVLVSDGDYGVEVGIAGAWRRLYQTIIGLIGLVMVLAGGALILEVLFDALIEFLGSSIGDQLRRNQLSDGIAMLLIGALLMRVTQLRWQSIIAANPAEGKTGLRRVYLYASVVISALATLAPATLLLRELLLILLGEGSGSLVSLLSDLTTPLAVGAVGAVMWWWHWRNLRDEIEAVGESAESVMVRRVYYYLLAAVALGIVWYGAAEMTTALLDWLFGPQGVGGRHSIWVVPLATGLSLLAVGTPVWSNHWRAVQSVAGRDDEPGADERSSGPRRVYLYGIALVSALFILYYLIQVVYRIFLWLLGDPMADILSVQTAGDIARSLIAAIVWGYHVMVIRKDGQMGAHASSQTNLSMDFPMGPEESALQSLSPEEERQVLAEKIKGLEQELAAARTALAELDRAEEDSSNWYHTV